MLTPKLESPQLAIPKTTPQQRLGVRLIFTKSSRIRIHRNGDAQLPLLLPLRPHGGRGFVDTARGGELGAGNETMTRYPQTGDFITNVSARRGEVGGRVVAF